MSGRSIVLLFIVIILVQCQSGSTIFGLRLAKKEYTFGDTLMIKKQDKFDSIHIYIANERIPYIDFNKTDYHLGLNTIKVEAFQSGKKLQKDFSIKILSDIPTKIIEPQLIQTYPHDSKTFTQGLEYHDGLIYESSGLFKKSYLTSYRLGQTKPKNQITLNKKYFAEGLTVAKDKIYLLTWKSKKIIILDKASFEVLEEIDLPSEINEGWGITYNEGKFYISNGSSKIYILNNDFKVLKHFYITGSDNIYTNINELEFYNNKIYANVWQDESILEIEPATGQVTSKHVLNDYVQSEKMKGSDVLNGITFLPNGNLLFTGKNWSTIYEIKF